VVVVVEMGIRSMVSHSLVPFPTATQKQAFKYLH